MIFLRCSVVGNRKFEWWRYLRSCQGVCPCETGRRKIKYRISKRVRSG